jgi:hypothetical protein
MIGGKVINVHDGGGCFDGNNLSVRCVEKRRSDGISVTVGIGDSVWWQAGWIMWTPEASDRLACGVDFDIQLPKVGYSH